MDMFTKVGGARCVEAGRKLQSYLDGELDADARQRLSTHLELCRRCGLEADVYRQLKASLARVNQNHNPSGLEQSMQRLRAIAEDLIHNGPPAAEFITL